MTIRSDQEVIKEKLELFELWYETGKPVFGLDDYAVLFQAGTFEYGKRAEQFCDAIYKYGHVPGKRGGE